ncbi:hypothetical protein FGD67_15440 [Colwellia sp. M166]|uniref:hypothetical protein n=1 Tax=Colwellia sp. M166 TaxID=2583805 RepID=UPI00211DB5B9|nr:hypothetical protein [Colwellia sp. M166]UUO24463.1 hypothetical protein FGD67_15440 [Colwellia sp. M166]
MFQTGRSGALTVGTIYNYHKVIKKLCHYANEKSISITEVLASEQNVTKFINSKVNSSSILIYFTAFLGHLLELGETQTGVPTLGLKAITDIRALRESIQDSKQHPVIPPRIFSGFLSELWSLIFSFKKIQVSLISLVEKCVENKRYGRRQVLKNIDIYGIELNFAEAVEFHGLTSELDSLGITRVTNLHGYILAIQDAGRYLLHTYSGMRYSELLSLMLNCLSIEKSKHGKIVRLLGKTSKLVGQRKTAAWITSKESETIVEVLQSIAKLVTFGHDFTAEELILFPSPSYLGFVGSKRNSTACLPHGHSSSTLWRFINIKEIEINNDDLNFLEIVDDSRAWRMEEQFKIGERWSFSSHQFRRTLAYYCRQSGLVKLSTLKRQLKHITREMSLYYAQGNEYSELFDTNEHFYKEYDRSRPEVDTLAYVLELLLSEETLYGSHGNHIERFNKPKSEQEKIKILSNRGDIVKKFKNGEIAYQETALGACTTTSPCNKKLLGHISACIKCTDAVLKPSKVQNVMNYQSKFVESLDQNSIEYRTEKNGTRSTIITTK